MSKICCFTGHRVLPRYAENELFARVENTVRDLIVNEGYVHFRTGGAIGFDTIAAISVLKLKKEFPHIKLHLILPCKDQDRYMNRFERKFYRYTLARADSVTYIQERYSNGVMARRNRALVDGSGICVAFLTHAKGGTFQTVNMARKAKIGVINLK